MSANHHAKIVNAVRKSLASYGVDKDESITDALERFHQRLTDAERVAQELLEEHTRLKAEAKPGESIRILEGVSLSYASSSPRAQKLRDAGIQLVTDKTGDKTADVYAIVPGAQSKAA